MNDMDKVASHLSSIEEHLNAATHIMRNVTYLQPMIPDLYAPIGALANISSAIHDFLDALPDLAGYDPTEYYHSQGRNPGESMECAELALVAASEDLQELHVHISQVWSAISPIGKTAS